MNIFKKSHKISIRKFKKLMEDFDLQEEVTLN